MLAGLFYCRVINGRKLLKKALFKRLWLLQANMEFEEIYLIKPFESSLECLLIYISTYLRWGLGLSIDVVVTKIIFHLKKKNNFLLLLFSLRNPWIGIRYINFKYFE